MKVTVEILTLKFFYTEIEENATVEELRREIATVGNFEDDRLVLVHDDGKILKDEQQVLAECGVGEGSIVLFVLHVE